MHGLDALVEGLFDHAGLFPPASLDMDEMLRTAAAFPKTLQRPALVANEIVVTPEQGEAITDARLKAAGFDGARPLGICVVGVPIAAAADEARRVTEHNDDAMASDIPRRVTSLEVTCDDMDQAAIRTAHELRFLLGDVRVYLEPRWDEETWHERRAEAFDAVAALNADAEQPRVGLKVRCAGPTALGPDVLAKVVADVVANGTPFKATQGLHHVVAGKDPVGFLGLTVALRLHGAGALDAADLAACIGERDAAAFSFQGGIAWREHQVPLGEVGNAMAKVPFSIGSCSIAEPDEELNAL